MKKSQKKRKISIIAGSRGEWGYYQPIIREISKRKNLDYGVIATNMHLLDRFGSSIEQIHKDGYKVDATIHNTIDGYNHVTMSKSLGLFMLQIPEILRSTGADIILIGGDRGEQLMAAIAGAHLYIPVAHIQAGEISGNIDGVSRHAITKFAHIHFAANEDAAQRLLRMGEEDFRVQHVGAPQLDDLIGGAVTPKQELFKKFGLNDKKPIFLVAQHPITEEFDKAYEHMKETLDAISKFDAQVVIIMNNSDAGSTEIQNAIRDHKKPNMKTYPNVQREDYASLMKHADVLIGNSSSGLLEAPSFRLPAVNIGDRQYGRLQGKNVINVGHASADIVKAIKKALSPQFVKSLKDCVNPYGDGFSAKRIVDILENLVIDSKLLVKRLTY